MKRRRRGKGGGGVRILFPLWSEGEGTRPSKLVSSLSQHMGGGGFEFPPPYGQKVEGGGLGWARNHISPWPYSAPHQNVLKLFCSSSLSCFQYSNRSCCLWFSWPLGAGKGSGHCGDRLKISPTTAWTHSWLVDCWNARLESRC